MWKTKLRGDPSLVEDIPGVRIRDGKVQGAIDAVSAAKLAMGRSALVDVSPELTWAKRSLARDYQKRGVEFLIHTLQTHYGALLADEMGLGKTFQALEVRERLCADTGRTLVCCPAAARETWRKELTKWGVKNSVVLSPTGSKRDWQVAAEAQTVITSYHHGMLDRAIGAAFPSDTPRLLVLDEAHRLRGRHSLRSAALKTVAALCTYRLALTATPSYDRPRDLWQILNILLGFTFGSKWDFDRRYCAGALNSWGGLDNKGSSNVDELRHRLSFYMLRREKADVAKELPSLDRQIRWVDPTPEARRAYAAAQLGLGKTSLHQAMLATLSGKMEEACLLAQEAKRFLLVTWLREHAAQLSRMLVEEYDTPNLLLTGDLSTERRQRIIDQATAQRVGIVATLDSVAESLNMQGVANVGISHSLDWSPLKEAQKEGRLHRLGTTEPVIWYYVAMRQSSDEAIIHTVIEKLDQWTSILAKKGPTNEVRKLRHALGDAIDSPEAVRLEKKVLEQIYKEMKG